MGHVLPLRVRRSMDLGPGAGRQLGEHHHRAKLRAGIGHRTAPSGRDLTRGMSVPTVTASPPSTPRARIWAATVTTVVVLALAFTGGLLASPDGGTAVIFVERISSAISGLANGAGS